MKPHFISILLSIFFLGMLNAQEKNNFRPKVWVKGFANERDSLSLNSYSPFKFSSKFTILPQKQVLGFSNSVYVIYKSTSSESVKLLSILEEGKQHRLFTRHIEAQGKLDIFEGNLNSGVISHYAFKSLKPEQDNYLLLNNLSQDQNTQVYEVLICNQRQNSISLKKIETYLSLKYGISLANPANYICNKGESIWDSKLNTSFNHNIIGIGKNDYFSMNHYKTTHSEDSFLSFGIYVDSLKPGVNTLKQNNFLLIGDNGKAISYKDRGESAILERVWLLQSHLEEPKKLTFTFNQTPEPNTEYFLYLSNKSTLDLKSPDLVALPANTLDSLQISFTDVSLDLLKAESRYVFLGKRINFDFEIKSLERCFDGGLQLNLTGGVEPYTIRLIDSVGKEQVYVGSQEEWKLDDLPSGDYSISISDALGNKRHKNTEVHTSSLISLQLAKQWELADDNQVILIKPKLTTINSENLKYQWYHKDQLLSNHDYLETATPGIYSLVINDTKGCKQTKEFEVFSSSNIQTASNTWTVIPNPTKIGEAFKVSFDLYEPSNVTFYIFTVEGKFRYKKELGIITQYEFDHILYDTGVYFIIAVIKGKADIKKIIIH